MWRHPQVLFWIILLLTAAAVLFVLPQPYGHRFLPWRLGLDLIGGSHLVYQVDTSKINPADKDSVLNGLRDVIERRVNLFGVSEPQVFVTKAAGQAGLVIELAGVKDVGEAIKQIGETPLLDFREVRGQGTSTEVLPTNLTGRYVTNAQVNFDPTSQLPEIDFTLNDAGATIFQELTKNNVGKPICIFIDNQMIIPTSATDSCPRVQSEIAGGRARITGQFSIQTARAIVERFNAGALPAPITLVNQETVSASLGADLLRKAIVAGLVGTLLVMSFMITYYGKQGLIAALALLVYVPITLALFKLVGVTMTLAGLAGFILTIGMAVDANILIFERIKEEVVRGLAPGAAVTEGFRRAWPSIRDSNVSTMLTALILYGLTSSFIRGFGLTLFLGVLLSMFSAIFVTWTFLRVFTKQS